MLQDRLSTLVRYGNAMVVTRIGASGHMVNSRTVTSSRNRGRSAPLLPDLYRDPYQDLYQDPINDASYTKYVYTDTYQIRIYRYVTNGAT